MQNKNVLTIQSLSCFGKSSLTVALPALSAMGFETSVMPTALLSAHTGGLGVPLRAEIYDFPQKSFGHWCELGLKFSGISSGYLGTALNVKALLEYTEKLKENDGIYICDPAFADNGKMYSGIDVDFPKEIIRLIENADIITPNITESCYLTDTEYKKNANEKYYEELAFKLSKLTNAKIIITGIEKDNEIGSLIFENNNIKYVYSKKIPHSYHGTGDLFAALLLGFTLKGFDIKSATKKAGDFVSECLAYTYNNIKDERYGIMFENNLYKLNILED